MLLVPLLFAATLSASEVPLGSTDLAPAPYRQEVASVASNGQDFLVLWRDRRTTIDGVYDPHQPALYVAHPDAIDGRKIADGADGRLTHTDTGYLLVTSSFDRISATMLDDDGVPLGPAKHVADGAIEGLASNGHSALVVFFKGSERFVAILTATGDAASIAAVAPANEPAVIEPYVTATGMYAFVAKYAYAIELTNVTPFGAVTRRVLSIVGPYFSGVAAAFANDRVLVAKEEGFYPPSLFVASYELYDGEGNALSKETLAAGLPWNFTVTTSGPSAWWDGREFAVAYRWEDGIRVVHVDADGALLDDAPTLLSGPDGDPPRFIASATQTLLAWNDGDVKTSIDDAPPHVLPLTEHLQRSPVIANGPLGPVVVWRDGYPNSEILASRPGDEAKTVGPALGVDQEAPAISRGRDAFLVVWRDHQGQDRAFRIFARRLAFDGTLLDDAPVAIASDVQAPWADASRVSASFDGANWIVVWAGTAIRGVRVGSDGRALEAPFDIARAQNPQAPVVVVPWVVWIDAPACCLGAPPPPGPPRGAIRVNAIGSTTSTLLWAGALPSSLAAVRGMTAWTAIDLDTNQQCVFAMPTHDDGSAAGAAQHVACSSATQATITPEGDGFLVAWADAGGVRGIHIDATGHPTDTPFLIAPGGFAPSLAGGAITYMRIAPESGNVSRAFVREGF